MLPNLGMSKRDAISAMYDIATKEEIDTKKAQRAARLAALFTSDVWKYDLFPILSQMHDDYLMEVKAKKLDVDALKVFDDFLVRLDGSVQIGVGAIQRMAQRRLEAAERQPN